MVSEHSIQERSIGATVTRNESHFAAFHASSVSGYPKYPSALNASSKRVRVPARVNQRLVDDITADTASDIPCIAENFVRVHPTLGESEIRQISPGEINLNSADGSPHKIVGYIRFHLTLGDITFPVEPVVLPSLGPDKGLVDNSIMGAFGAVPDRHREEISFKTSQMKMKATHRHVRPSQKDSDATQCSEVRLTADNSPVPVFLSRKCCIPPQHEMAVEVETASAPNETTAALIERLIVTCNGAQSTDVPDAFNIIVEARTVCQWSSVNKTATVQIANPSGRHVHLKRKKILGYISPVKSV